MNKNRLINEITNILAIALRHKIGSIVNGKELYAQKYAKDAEILIKEAEKLIFYKNWNLDDKVVIEQELKIKLKKELESKSFLDESKFEFMDKEVKGVL